MSRAAIVAPLVAKRRVEEGQGFLVIQLFLKQNGIGVTLPGASYFFSSGLFTPSCQGGSKREAERHP